MAVLWLVQRVGGPVNTITWLTDEQWAELRRKNAEQNKKSENNRR